MRRAAIAATAMMLSAMPAAAHFLLREPASWREQDAVGSPQKMGPCGDEGTAAATSAITVVAPGDTITILLDETIFHPGHYRVALAIHDRSELPPEPPVTPGATECGSVPVEAAPALPVLADGVLDHDAPFEGTQSIQVTLPSDVTCAHCTLQVLEFMSQHPAPCFYHHCADISIQAVTPPTDCTTDNECDDNNACTTDHCNLVTGLCEHLADVAATCDDANACTIDACTAAQGCVHHSVTLSDVTTGYLGGLDTTPCSGDHVPPAAGVLFQKADALVVRAARNPRKASRFLGRATQRLKGASKKVANAQARGISISCGSVLAAQVERAQARVDCLKSSAH